MGELLPRKLLSYTFFVTKTVESGYCLREVGSQFFLHLLIHNLSQCCVRTYFSLFLEVEGFFRTRRFIHEFLELLLQLVG